MNRLDSERRSQILSFLIPCWIVGLHDSVTARIFVSDLTNRLADRIGREMSEIVDSTGDIERANLSSGIGKRRFTRLTNGFPKKIENHAASVALFMMYYNFARQNKTLRCSPAQAAGVDGRLREIKDIVAMIEAYEKSN